MPVSVSTGSLGEPRAKRCKHCDESSHRNESGSGYWHLQLDRDLVETISAIYPDWFKSNMAEGGSPPNMRESPPKAMVDTSPLLNSLEQNKESLKVKLMLRRPVEQLVAQGIMPPLKTPAAFHGQRRQLERAKTGDLLKTKIQQRPSRTELESRHILEADPHVDPSLAEKQRMLKKARLADQLNDQLSHRPGPLELIRKNILHTEEPIEHAVKAGHIPYKATCEGQLNRPQHPLSYVNPEDDSQSSEDNNASPGPPDVLETAAKSAGIVVSLIPTSENVLLATSGVPSVKAADSSGDLIFATGTAAPLLSQASASSPVSLVSSTSTLSPLSSIASPVPSIISQPATPGHISSSSVVSRPIANSVSRSDAPGKDKNRKKSKSKAAPKARTIKFHEYKGPPSAQKSTVNNANNGETSYDLLLQQQTLLLQFQLQLQHKYPQIILPATQKNSSESNQNNGGANPLPTAAPLNAAPADSASVGIRLLGRLEDMKVSDLKAELKRRNLPVSGSKPQLIERLKPFTGTGSTSTTTSDFNTAAAAVADDNAQRNSPQPNNGCVEVASPLSTLPDDQMDVTDCDTLSPKTPQSITNTNAADQLHHHQQQQQQQQLKSQDDIVREQQRQIEELQRELTLSQLKLKAATRAEPKAQLFVLQQHLQARQQQQQMVQRIQAQQNMDEQKLMQQQQHVAFQNQKNLAGSLVLKGTDAAIVLGHLVQEKNKVNNGHNRSNSLPNFISSLINSSVKCAASEEAKVQQQMYQDQFAAPPATPPAPVKKEKTPGVKSQAVEDVLDILIKSGELPPSAAQDPSTPSSAGSTKLVSEPPIFPASFAAAPATNSQTSENELGFDTADILNTLDLDGVDFNFMEMCTQSNQSNNNVPTAGSAGVVDNGNADMVVPMETDDWLESLLPTGNANNNNTAANNNVLLDASAPSHELGYDPLLAIGQEEIFDPFDLEEYRSPSDLAASFSWDRVDFAA